MALPCFPIFQLNSTRGIVEAIQGIVSNHANVCVEALSALPKCIDSEILRLAQVAMKSLLYETKDCNSFVFHIILDSFLGDIT